jgi:hypothetical protein
MGLAEIGWGVQMRGVKALLTAVIVMGVMIVLGTAVLISAVVSRTMHKPPSAGATAAVAPALLLAQPSGTRITSVTRQSDTLVVVGLAGGGGDRLLVWDVVAGRVVGRLALDR